MKKTAIIFAFIGVLLALSGPLVFAQSRGDAERLHREAHELFQKARSNADMRQAEGKYSQALSVFERFGDRRKMGVIYNGLGRIYAGWGQPVRAVECYEKSLALSTETGNMLEKAWALINLGNVYSNWGRYDKASEFFNESLVIMIDLKDHRGEASALGNLGIVFKELGQYEKAVENYQKALAIARHSKDLKSEAYALGNLGNIYKELTEYDKAVEYYEKSLAVARELRDRKGEELSLNNLGTVYMNWGQYEKAVNFCRKAAAIARELNDRKGEGAAQINLGNICKEWGQFEKAANYFGEALATARDLKDLKSEEYALNNLGVVYKNWGQYDKAVDHYKKALAIARDLKDYKGEGGTLNNLGVVYSEWGRYDEAVEEYEKSLAIARDLKDRMTQGKSLNNLGAVYMNWGWYDKAIECYEQALSLKRELKDVQGEGLALNNLGSVYMQRQEFRKALANFTKAMNIYQKSGIPVGWSKNVIGNLYLDMGDIENAEPLLIEAGYWGSLGRLQLLKSDYGQAREYYEKLRQAAEKSRTVDDLFTAYTGLGTAYEGMGDDNHAEGCFLKAVELTEDLRSSLPKAQRETFFDVRIKGFLRTAPYDGLARVRIKLNRSLDAFEDSEYTKARVFAEEMCRLSDGSAFNIPADVAKEDRELSDRLSALKKKRQEAYEKANLEIIAILEPQVQEMEQKLQAHIKMLRESYPLFAATKYPGPVNLHQTALRENEWVLAYHVTDPGIIIYLTKGKEIVKALLKIVPRSELDALILRFRKPLEVIPGIDDLDHKLKSFDLTTGKKLSNLLLSEILEHLPRNVPLIVVPDDSLGIVPFEMLVLNDGGIIKTDTAHPYVWGAEFFGDRNPISYSQSVTALSLSRIHAKSKPKEAGLLAVADPVFNEQDERIMKSTKKDSPSGEQATAYKRLILMAAENDPQMGGLRFPRLSLTGDLARVLSEKSNNRATVCTGFEANKDNFLNNISQKLNRYDKIVFATHGYFGKDLPGIMEPVLVLTLVPPGTDGYLRMTEVIGLDMNADIVALTGCQTGLGKRTAGEGTMGMGRAFQYAGAKSVLMSLWSVSEAASVNLVESFFQNIKDGKGKLEALVSAREEIRKKGFDHPFFWAGFVLVGESN